MESFGVFVYYNDFLYKFFTEMQYLSGIFQQQIYQLPLVVWEPLCSVLWSSYDD